jgi:ribosomal protein L7/L12
MRMLLVTMLLAAAPVLADEANCSVTLTELGDQKINVIKIVREYTGLGLKEAKDLVEAPKPKLLREGLTRVEADALVAALAAKGAAAEVHQKGAHGPAHPPKGEVGATFDVKLESYGQSKIQVIKIVKDRLGLGLKETKDLVESAPTVVAKGQSRPVAESMLKDLLAVGAKASLVEVR